MKDTELINIIGGSINGTMINAISRILTALLEVGRAIGSSISRYKSGRSC